MGKFLYTQNSFEKGELSSEFFSRENINGLSKLENMDVLAGGGLTRRKGLKLINDLEYDAKLINFVVGENDNYLIALSNQILSIYKDGQIVQRLITPWGTNDIAKVQYAQRFDSMIFTHPDYLPQVLENRDGEFILSDFGFHTTDDLLIKIPFMKFDDADGIKITITESDKGNNFAVFTVDKDFWTAENVNGLLYLIEKQWTVKEYISPTVVIVHCNGSYVIPDEPVTEWYESAFGVRRGYPISITFHQDRLVFGGSKSWPSGVWMSKVGNHKNFDTGTGLDDEAIFLTLVSKQRQQISTIVSSDNLQILTSVGEWAISNKPLTPSSVDIQQHTSVGSIVNRYLVPQQIEGHTVFIANNEKDIRELSLDDLGETYNANDLCALSKHLMDYPIDLAYNDKTGQLFIVMKNGDMAVLNKNSVLGTSAWGIYKTQGEFKSVAVIDGETFVSVKRDISYNLEKFSDECLNDAENYGFSVSASGLPFLGGKHPPQKIRIRKLSARILNTKSLYMNGKKVFLPNEIYETDHIGFSGDVTLNLLGTSLDTVLPVWRISSSEQLPLTVLSITLNGWYQI